MKKIIIILSLVFIYFGAFSQMKQKTITISEWLRLNGENIDSIYSIADTLFFVTDSGTFKMGSEIGGSATIITKDGLEYVDDTLRLKQANRNTAIINPFFWKSDNLGSSVIKLDSGYIGIGVQKLASNGGATDITLDTGAYFGHPIMLFKASGNVADNFQWALMDSLGFKYVFTHPSLADADSNFTLMDYYMVKTYVANHTGTSYKFSNGIVKSATGDTIKQDDDYTVKPGRIQIHNTLGHYYGTTSVGFRSELSILGSHAVLGSVNSTSNKGTVIANYPTYGQWYNKGVSNGVTLLVDSTNIYKYYHQSQIFRNDSNKVLNKGEVQTLIDAGSGMVYPPVGIPYSTGTGWGTSEYRDTTIILLNNTTGGNINIGQTEYAYVWNARITRGANWVDITNLSATGISSTITYSKGIWSQTATTGVTINSFNISSGQIRINYTTTNTGSDATMKLKLISKQ